MMPDINPQMTMSAQKISLGLGNSETDFGGKANYVAMYNCIYSIEPTFSPKLDIYIYSVFIVNCN